MLRPQRSTQIPSRHRESSISLMSVPGSRGPQISLFSSVDMRRMQHSANTLCAFFSSTQKCWSPHLPSFRRKSWNEGWYRWISWAWSFGISKMECISFSIRIASSLGIGSSLLREKNERGDRRAMIVPTTSLNFLDHSALSLSSYSSLIQFWNRQTRHMNIRYQYVQQAVRNGDITIEYMASAEQLADGLTKALKQENIVNR